MNRRAFCWAMLACACAATTPDTTLGGNPPLPIDRTPHVGDPAVARSFAAANNAFGFELWGALHQSGNLAIAPASVSIALGMTWLGARGDTAAQMAKVLHLADAGTAAAAMGEQLAQWNAPVDGAYELAVVERLFGEQTATFEPEFLAALQERFAAPLESVDFRRDFEGARERINGWVEQQTKDRIVDLLPAGSIDGDTRLVLTNAVYFKGDWLRAFDPNATHEGAFYVGGRTPERRTMMRQVSQLAYASTDAVQMVELPYRGEHLAMTLIIPRERDGLETLERGLDADGFAAMVGALQPAMVELTLPRFELEMPASLSLEPALVELGMPLAFGTGADFTGMSRTIRPLFIDDVFHRTFVAVDEEGTEAAAATAVVMATESASVEPDGIDVVADRPFLFVLRDTRSGAILFLGRVVDPTA
ncbi:MAG: serpin family protein [Deltaproteobacteria bacterium]|nr:serpin family protein [Deltaproteobacteria bacterium]MBK8714670.1 serpin family protein [Deltaproteobacteria bacterium]MBP7289282.1 serpin family protein [Nannocystaceae bacterium]